MVVMLMLLLLHSCHGLNPVLLDRRQHLHSVCRRPVLPSYWYLYSPAVVMAVEVVHAVPPSSSCQHYGVRNLLTLYQHVSKTASHSLNVVFTHLPLNVAVSLFYYIFFPVVGRYCYSGMCVIFFQSWGIFFSLAHIHMYEYVRTQLAVFHSTDLRRHASKGSQMPPSSSSSSSKSLSSLLLSTVCEAGIQLHRL